MPTVQTSVSPRTGGPSQCSKSRKLYYYFEDWKGRNKLIICRLYESLGFKKKHTKSPKTNY